MIDHLVLPAPSTNRVYAGSAAEVLGAELEVVLPGIDPTSIAVTEVGGVDHVAFRAPTDAAALARVSGIWMAYERVAPDLLRPLTRPRADLLDEDLITIPRYQGKTNEQFTRLMVNLAMATVDHDQLGRGGPLDVLDPMCGRGTTISCAWLAGHNGFGVESDQSAIEAHATFLRTWLRRKRLKHKLTVNPVRRDGKNLGKRLDVTLTPPDPTLPDASASLTGAIMPGDARDSLVLWGKRRFDAIVTDTPYGVVHGSRRAGSGSRDRSAAGLLADAVPQWADQLRPGGAMVIAWNTLGLARADLVSIMDDAGVTVHDTGPWRRFAHRVDSSIHRDLAVGLRR
ncbi:TRM11 family SAM-dependent methyltransferase [Microlunatus sp. Y2014]|uniref:TRM11 family SAM-dependent methyltransferase n=1 Tax=Microlunatus sp. Y2014 TaxID=3418488 RepID=UPI003DA7778F